MKIRIPKFVRFLAILLVLIAALWVLDHSLREYHYHDIVRQIRAIPAHQVWLALLLTLLNYLVLTGYDTLGFRYIRHPLPYRKIAMASFIGYAFSQSLGFPLLTGASVRYRLYSAWGLSTSEIAEIVAFTSFTFWLGIFTIGGLAFLIQPIPVPEALELPFASIRPLGIILIALAAAYCVLTATRKKPVQIREWQFSPPPLQLSLFQIFISSLDWALAAAVLYVLLPAHSGITYAGFVGIFLAAQILGLISHIPGGLGVFETIVVLLLSPRVSAGALVGSLVAYRGVYYLFPLSLSAVLFGVHEVLERKEGVKRIARFFGQWVPEIAPTIFALATFAAGMVLLFSGATPPVRGRLEVLQRLVPLPLLEVSHLVGSMAGVGLLLLARGLQRRLDGAYGLTAILLTAGMVASLLKGFDYEEAILMGVMLTALLPCHSFFYRKASLTGERFTRGWAAAILLVLISSVWLTFFSYKHVPYSHELWWQFEFSGDAPRSLRAVVGAFGFAFVVALAQLLRAAPPEPGWPGSTELAKAHNVISTCKDSSASLALLRDKVLLFSQSQQTFLMYGIEGRSWIALGDPIGNDSEKPELIWRFREIADRHDGWSVFYEVHRQNLPLYLDLGLTLLKLGEEARVPLETFTLDGQARKTFRHLLNKFHKDGYSFEIIPPEQVSGVLPELKKISDSWLQQKNTREKGFSLGFFSPEYLAYFPAGLVKKDQQILAFITIWLGAEKEELSLDLMRYRPDAPNGVMDYLFLSLMFWGKEQGYHWFNLGMAPFSGLEDRSLAPLWNRLGALVYRHGEHFYNFQGLRQYKDKFDPVWEPKYLASPGGLALPRILANLASLVSGGLRGVVTK